MVKTTIDGLAVRKSSGGGRVAQQPTRRQVGGSLSDPVRRRAAAKVATKRAAQATEKQPKRLAASDDFLQPVRELNFDEPDTSLGAKSETDWSDLLDEINEKKPAPVEKPGSDLDPLLEAWGADEEFDDEPKKHTKVPRKKKRKVLKTVLIVLAILLVVGGIVAFVWGDQIISRLTNGQSGLWDTLTAMVSDEVIPFATDSKGRTNVLIFGTEGFDMDGSADGGGTHDGAELTDSIMVISLDQETKDVALLSIPRDLKVSGACMVGKINEVFSCNNQNGTNEEAGAKALMKQVGQVLGIDFQYWAHVNWGSLMQIVDSLGGITITLDEDIDDRGYTGVVAQAGVPVEINGYQAIAFARARYGTNGGDFTRANTQQKIVEGIVKKVLDQGVGVAEAFNLLNILGDNLRTNFSSDLIKSAYQLSRGFDISNIRQVPLADYENGVYYVTSETIDGYSYVLPKGEGSVSGTVRLQDYIRKMFSSDPILREDPTLAIFNATDSYGVAGAERTKLEANGYEVITVGDADSDDCIEQYCLYAMNNQNPATAEMLASRYGMVMRSAAELPTDIWPAGADFVIVVGQAE